MIELPWDRTTVPHCVLEITRDCNLSCRACYRQKQPGYKSLAALTGDLEALEGKQRVQTVSLAGGEPTLHPQLPEIVRLVRRRGHKASLVTNALLLDDPLLAELKDAGLDVVMIHVDEGQERPDLPAGAGIEEINGLRRSIARRVAAHGLDAGLCVTLYREHFANLEALLHCLIENPEINFLFATHAAEIEEIVQHSTLGGAPAGCGLYRAAPTRNSQVIERLAGVFGVRPFACIPPREADAAELPCISYFLPVLHGRRHRLRPVTAGAADRLLLRLSRLLGGRYRYYTRNSWPANAVQLLASGFSGGLAANLGTLLRSLLPGVRLRCKRLVFENAPVVLDDGTVNCCDFCPNATARDGQVMPVCLADHLAPATAGGGRD